MSRPRFTYVVLAHTDPANVLRLVRRVPTLSPDAAVLVRHNVEGLFDEGVLEYEGAQQFLSDRIVRWGEWSQLESVLEALDVARSRAEGDYYVVISGQDYPIRNLKTWENEVVARGCDALVDPMTPQPRNVDLRWSVVGEPGIGDGRLGRAIRAAGARLGSVVPELVEFYPVTRDGATRWWIGRPRRGQEPPVELLKAALWGTYSAAAITTALTRHGTDSDVREFFRTIRTPDEYYLPSLVAAAGLRVAFGCTSAKKFDRGSPSPRWVGLEELTEFAAGDAAFARKFPPGVDAAVIAAADALSSR